MTSEVPASRSADALDREPDDRPADRGGGYELLAAPARAAPDALFRLLVASVRDDAIFLLDPAGRVATWNAGAARLKGYTAEEIVGRQFSAFSPREDVQAGRCDLALEVAARDGRFENEGWRIRKDGSAFWANVVITAVRDRSGGLVGFAKVTRDLTDRKHAEDERERFRMFVASVQDYAMLILDPEGKVESWNIGAERICGHRADEVIGRQFSTFYPPEDGPGALALVGEFTPDVAILDIGLPGMDGHELAAQLRDRPAMSRVRLIAPSGYGQASDLARSRSAGFDRHPVKPVEVRRRVDTISELTC